VAKWDGEWTSAPTPGGPLAFDRLTDLSVGGWGVWAVGYSANQSFESSRSRPIAMRFDGMVWIPTPVPVLNLPDHRWYGIDGTSGDDQWAVGEAFGVSGGRAVVWHWDATSWEREPIRREGQYSRLASVEAFARDDAWAVGTKFVRGNDHGYTLHWDGAAWTEMPVPAETIYQDTLLSVSGSGPDDVWAVGYVLDVFGPTESYQTTAVHWDGAAWSVVPTPDMSQLNNYLFSVAAVSPTEAWAVGLWDDGHALRTLVERWDGAAWNVVPSESPYGYGNELYAVDADDADAVAVGQGSDGLVTVDALVLRPR
jgi:hypothetical protein